MIYLWVKALHVIAIIAWMAGLLYLPRLFVYHTQAEAGSGEAETFKVMERRLLKGIMNPAMLVAWLAGLWLVWETEAWRQGWFHLKATLVILLSAYHMWLGAKRRAFEADRNTISERGWRFLNEVPTLLMIGIVVAVIVRPF